MSQQAAYHEGYRKALEEVSALVSSLRDVHEDLGSVLAEIDRKIERARCFGRSSLASNASGHQGF